MVVNTELNKTVFPQKKQKNKTNQQQQHPKNKQTKKKRYSNNVENEHHFLLTRPKCNSFSHIIIICQLYKHLYL